jgi:hypothetical protein
VSIFTQLIQQVGPQLPKLFGSFTQLLEQLVPLMPTITGFIRDFVSGVTVFMQVNALAAAGLKVFVDGILKVGDAIINLPATLGKIGDTIRNFFTNFVPEAVQWGKNLVGGLIQGLKDATGLTGVTNATKGIVDIISQFFQQSPAKKGPFSGSGYTLIRGQKMVTDMAAGMMSAQSSVEAAAASTATAASGALSGGSAGGAPAPGGSNTAGSALLPDNIAGASTDVLTAYLRHQFSDNHGLKGLSKDLGEFLQVAQNGFNLLNTHAVQPLFQALGMVPGANDQAWRKQTPEEQQQESQRKSLQDNKTQGATWQDVTGEPPAWPGQQSPDASVPLVQNPDGTWTSPDPAWAHLIKRESGGVNQRQKIVDANSGGNEAEGLFQITPETWRAHGGADFAPNALAASAQEQAAVAARILRGNPTGSDWGAGLSGREDAQALLSGLTGAPPPGAKGPTWQQVTAPPAGIPGASAATGAASADYKNWYPVAGAQESPTGRKIYTGPHTEDTGGAVVPNVATAEEIVKQLFPGVSVNNDYRPKDGYNEHSSGEAIDFSINPDGKMGIRTPEGQTQGNALRDFFVANAKRLGLEYGLWDQTQWNPDGTSSPMEDRGGVTANHGDHFHARFLPAGATSANAQPAASDALSGGLVLPSGKTIDQLTDNTAKSATANDQLLQAYLQGNPELAQQLTAARAPGASDETVMGSLTGINKTITDLTTQDPVGNKNTIDALRSQQSQIAQQQGFTQQQGPLAQAQAIAGGAAGAITGVFQSIQSGLDALAATQDITDRLVYGVRNTEDINKIIDNVQKYITFAADVVSTVGSILSTAGSFTGGSDFGGTSAAGSILSLVAGVMQGVNAAIDFGQQIYEVASGYVGRFLSFLAAGPGGTDLMGNVGFMLNKNTGQLISYSQDNPQKQNTLAGSSFINGLYGYGQGGAAASPGVGQLNIYAGPGQSVGATMNEAMWLVNTGGTTGALSPASF